MGLFSKDIKNMDDLFVHTLRDIYYAEKQIVKSLPEMIDKANNPQLKQGFQTQLCWAGDHVRSAPMTDSYRTSRQVGPNCFSTRLVLRGVPAHLTRRA
jgi:hypothetical protein